MKRVSHEFSCLERRLDGFFVLDSAEFVAGAKVHSLVGFTNNGKQAFVVTGIEASFRWEI